MWLRFKGGKVVDADASKGKDFLLKMMDQDKGGRTLGELAIGTNYGITKFTKNTLFDEKIGGTMHMALGPPCPKPAARTRVPFTGISCAISERAAESRPTARSSPKTGVSYDPPGRNRSVIARDRA